MYVNLLLSIVILIYLINFQELPQLLSTSIAPLHTVQTPISTLFLFIYLSSFFEAGSPYPALATMKLTV